MLACLGWVRWSPLTFRRVLLLVACLVVVLTTTPIAIAQQTQTPAAEQWRQLANASRFFDQMSWSVGEFLFAIPGASLAQFGHDCDQFRESLRRIGVIAHGGDPS